ncbi:MAG: aldo/keto reductase [Candidatus Hydrogenedentota bacterium]
MSLNRRAFCKKLGYGAAGLVAAASLGRLGAPTSHAALGNGSVPRRKLGRNGLMASVLAMGAGSRFTGDGFLSEADREEYLAACIDHGINYVDTAVSYGPSEEMLGEMLTDNDWDRFILSTKTNSSTHDGIMADFQTSQSRLGRDHFDVYLVHNGALGNSVEENAEAFSTMRALREAGDVANIGFSSHGAVTPAVAVELVKEFDLDHCILTIGHGQEDYREVIPDIVATGCTVAAFKVTRHLEGEGPGSNARDIYRDVLGRPYTSAIISHSNEGEGVTWKDVLAENLATARQYGETGDTRAALAGFVVPTV